MLHIVSRSLLFEQCLQYCSVSDEIIVINQGICVLAGTEMTTTTAIYAIEEEVKKRILMTHIPKEINLIDYEQFVKLVIKHPQTLTWF